MTDNSATTFTSEARLSLLGNEPPGWGALQIVIVAARLAAQLLVAVRSNAVCDAGGARAYRQMLPAE